MDLGGVEVTTDISTGKLRSNLKSLMIGSTREHPCVDLVFEILLRLHLSSIGVCKRVCKTWRSIITSPYFMRTYLERKHLLGIPHVLMHEIDDTLVSLADVRSGDIIARIRPPDTCRLFGSCNGAILCDRVRDGLLLFNPITGKSVDIPYPPKEPNLCSEVLNYSLGFDTSTKKFKIVAFDKNFKTCMIFKVGDSSWQPVCGVGCNMCHDCVVYDLCQPLRWIILRCNGHIIWYFDFVEEKFKSFKKGNYQTSNEKELENELQENFLLPILSVVCNENHDGNMKRCLKLWTMNMHKNNAGLQMYKIEVPTYHRGRFVFRTSALLNYGEDIAVQKSMIEKLGHIGIDAEVYLNKFLLVSLNSHASNWFYEFSCIESLG